MIKTSKKILLVAFSSVFALSSANAGISVSNSTNDMAISPVMNNSSSGAKSIDDDGSLRIKVKPTEAGYSVYQPLNPTSDSIPKDQYMPEYKRKKLVTSEGEVINTVHDLKKIVPDSHKNIEDRIKGDLGSLVIFTDIGSMDEKVVETINEASKLPALKKFYFMKQIKSMMAMTTLSVKTGGKLEVSLSMDPKNKNARRMHVSSYPTMIYITPFDERIKYSVSSGSLTAMKIKMGEVAELLAEQEKQKAKARAMARQ